MGVADVEFESDGQGGHYAFINDHHVIVQTGGDDTKTKGHHAWIVPDDGSQGKQYRLNKEKDRKEFDEDVTALQNGETPDLSGNEDANQRGRFNLWRALGLGRRERGEGVKAHPDGRGDERGDIRFPDLDRLPNMDVPVPGLGDDVPMPPGPSDEVKDWIVKGGTLPREIRRDLEELAKL